MSSFDPDITNVHQIYAQTARQGQMASAVILLIAVAAGGALYGLNPSGFFSSTNYPALITLGSLGAFSVLGLFASTVVRCCASPTPSAPPVVSPPPAPPPAPAPTQVAPLNRADVPTILLHYIADLMDGVTNLVVALHAAYYRTESKAIENSAELSAALNGLKTLVLNIFQDSQQMGRMALIGAFCERIDPIILSSYLQKLPTELIHDFSQLFIDPRDSNPGATTIVNHVRLATTEMCKHVWTQDQQFNGLWEKMQKANEAYEKSQQLLLTDQSDKIKEEAAQKVKEYYLARANLFDHLLKKSIEKNQWDTWAPQLIPAYLENNLAVFRNTIPTILEQIFTGHEENGMFTLNRASIFAATTAPNVACQLIENFLSQLPLDALYQKELVDLAKILLSALASPIYYATCLPFNLFSTSQPRPIYTALQKTLFTSLTLAPFSHYSHCRTWQGYLSAYANYLKLFAAKLEAIQAGT